ncbi:hypothetical protein [Abyssogena phaseoliformis symbiont]|uniref:hypothetical protein n=1 Tax=Abyssogena phaseoliformis symbiont TaxID=596095 RepID=UPI0019153E44|nr:hypothetical protein [Abyssogena phaseoliformis symbiont]
MKFIDSHHSYYDKEILDNILISASDKGASDIIFKSGHHISFSYHDEVVIDNVSKPIVDTELSAYLNDIYISSATAPLSQAKALDFSYSVKVDKSKSIRFRVNTTTVLLNGNNIRF